MFHKMVLLLSLSIASGGAAAQYFCDTEANVPEEPIKAELVLGFVPSRSVNEIQVSAAKIADYLVRTTGYQVRHVTLSNYAAVAVAMKAGRVDLAFVGPVNYLVIHEHAGAYPITAAVRDGRKGYHGLIITRTDAGIDSLAQLRGKTMAFGDALSASGNLYPKAALMEVGIDPQHDLRSIMVNNQSAIVLSVLKGKVDGGAIYQDARLNPEVLKYYPNVLKDSRVLQVSRLIPADPQIVRPGLNRAQVQVLREALIRLAEDEQAKPWLQALYGIEGLSPASDADYQELRTTVATVAPNLLKCRNRPL